MRVVERASMRAPSDELEGKHRRAAASCGVLHCCVWMAGVEDFLFLKYTEYMDVRVIRVPVCLTRNFINNFGYRKLLPKL
jgi:hypothetical protein